MKILDELDGDSARSTQFLSASCTAILEVSTAHAGLTLSGMA